MQTTGSIYQFFIAINSFFNKKIPINDTNNAPGVIKIRFVKPPYNSGSDSFITMVPSSVKIIPEKAKRLFTK